MEIEKEEQQIPKSEPDLDHMTQLVQSLFKYMNFYDQMDFDAG